MNGERLICSTGSFERCAKCGDEFPWIRLFPYRHQVSGHHRVMLFNSETICKPLMIKEYDFYRSVPEAIKRFVPKLHGIARASSETDEHGYDIIYAQPIPNAELKAPIPCQCNSSSSKSNGCSDGLPCQWRYTPGEGEKQEEQIYDENPWAQRTQQMSFKRNMHKTDGSKLILLEHIGYSYKFPCILDLKMGVQQHGDDATEVKAREHQKRCEKSTSGSLGVRLCGMQVYDPETNTYFYTDKYTGRQLDEDGFRNCLLAFLNAGKRFDALAPITHLLDNLCKSIDSLDACRFFGSSLLLLYDGDIHRLCDVEVRMIDFANVTLYNEAHVGPDHGYMFGLKNLCKLLDDIKCCSSAVIEK